MTINAPGSVTKMGDIEVRILSVSIRAKSTIQYEVSWIVGGDRKTAWVEESELEDSVDTIEVGFK